MVDQQLNAKVKKSNRITIISHEIPYPPNHGGRLDTWNRIKGLSDLGVDVQLIYWITDKKDINSKDREKISEDTKEAIEIIRKRSVKYVNSKYPSKMPSFFEAYNRSSAFDKVKTFNPDWIMLDGWPGYLAAKKISKALDRPLIYRSHNVESKYLWKIFKASKGLTKLKIFFNAMNMANAEKEIRETADLVADISEEDLREWDHDERSDKYYILPPIWIPTTIRQNNGSDDNKDIDILFVGNLWAPNNIEGLNWYIAKVMPIFTEIENRKPRIVFAGSNPTPKFIKLCESNNIECIANPREVDSFYKRAKVAINPVLKSSGVNIKMIEMLTSDNFIVATKAATRGLPKGLHKLIHIADNEANFARKLNEALASRHQVDQQERFKEINDQFGLTSLRRFIERLRELK